MNILHTIISYNTKKLYSDFFKNPTIKKVLINKNIKKILEVGIGSGASTIAFLSFNKNMSIEGLDIRNDLWEENKEIKNTIYNGEFFPFKDNTFNLVLIFLVLHHSLKPSHLLSESSRVSSRYILVLEEIKTGKFQNIIMVVYDLIINLLIFGHFISLGQFKREREMEEMFKNSQLKVISSVVLKKYFFIKRKAYLLKKN